MRKSPSDTVGVQVPRDTTAVTLWGEDIDPIRWIGPWLDRNQMAARTGYRCCSPRRLRYSAHPRISSDIAATPPNPMANGTNPRWTNIQATKALRTTAMAAIPACSRSACCPSTDASWGPGPPVPGTVRLSLLCARLLSMPCGYPASARETRPGSRPTPGGHFLDADGLAQHPRLGHAFCHRGTPSGTLHGQRGHRGAIQLVKRRMRGATGQGALEQDLFAMGQRIGNPGPRLRLLALNGLVHE